MNDIKWHYPSDDNFEELISKNLVHEIIAETDVCFRLSNTCYYSKYDGKLVDCDEKLLRFAFYE